MVVENFGVKYVGGKHALHFKKTFKENYTFTTEWDSKRLPGYTKKYLKQFIQKKTQPYPSVSINYGAKKNMPHNHHQHHLLTKREGNLFKKCEENFCL